MTQPIDHQQLHSMQQSALLARHSVRWETSLSVQRPPHPSRLLLCSVGEREATAMLSLSMVAERALSVLWDWTVRGEAMERRTTSWATTTRWKSTDFPSD